MIIGVDFSLTSTGVCAITDGGAETFTVKSKKEREWHDFPDRVELISNSISTRLNEGEVTALVIETPAFGAKSSALDKMFGGWWLFVTDLMLEFSVVPLRVTPAQVKKYATGKGNAGKDEVLAAVIRRYPDVLVTGNDQADALVLAAIGAAVMGEPFEVLTQKQQEVVDAVRDRAGGKP